MWNGAELQPPFHAIVKIESNQIIYQFTDQIDILLCQTIKNCSKKNYAFNGRKILEKHG